MFAILKLRSYWTNVQQIYKQCSQIIEDESLKIRMAIFQAVLECQGDE